MPQGYLSTGDRKREVFVAIRRSCSPNFPQAVVIDRRHLISEIIFTKGPKVNGSPSRGKGDEESIHGMRIVAELEPENGIEPLTNSLRIELGGALC